MWVRRDVLWLGTKGFYSGYEKRVYLRLGNSWFVGGLEQKHCR